MENIKFVIEKSERIEKLKADLYAKMPEIEADRGVLVTESYQATEGMPIIKRRSAAFAHILKNIPIWTVHGDADGTVPYSGTKNVVDAIIAAGGEDIFFTTRPAAGHNVWTWASQEDEIFEWLFDQRKQ